MSQIDVTALETNFTKWRQERAPDTSKDSDAFELYSIERVLKDADLSDDEIKSGWLAAPQVVGEREPEYNVYLLSTLLEK
jgi:hypothetical protein